MMKKVSWAITAGMLGETPTPGAATATPDQNDGSTFDPVEEQRKRTQRQEQEMRELMKEKDMVI